jgi:GNAT acetyltransferase-like protein
MPPVTISRSVDPPSDWLPYAAAYGSFYHRPEWADCLRDTYRFRFEFYTARTGSELKGLLPVAEVPPLVGPRRLVSLPFSYAAGPLAQDATVAAALVEAVRDRARERRIRRVEVKSWGEFPVPPQFHRTSHYAAYEVVTEGGEATLWNRLHPSSTQRSIRKGEKAGILVRQGATPADWLIMAELEEKTAHAHGLPAPPRRFFLEGCRRLQDAGLASVYLAVTAAGAPAAAITIWKGSRSWIYGFGASDPAHLAARPNHLLLWQALRDAAAAGCRFDLGRAAPEQAGLVEFKRRWGGQAIPLAYDYWPEPGGMNVAQRDRGPIAAAAAVWSRLPVSVARLGSGLYRYLG